jgi:hypothetical protein
MYALCIRLRSLVTSDLVWWCPADGPLRGGQPDRLGGHRLPGRDSGSGRVSRDRRLAWCGSSAASGLAQG